MSLPSRSPPRIASPPTPTRSSAARLGAPAGPAFRDFTQEQVDRIVQRVFEAPGNARLELARLAHEETGMGLYEHKVIKNAWASLLVYEDIRSHKTVGVISHDEASGITEIAQPKGPILATIPVTNPTSTAIFKILICTKTRNPVILSRPPRRPQVASGGPPRSCATRPWRPAPRRLDPVDHPGRESAYLDAVMRHRRLALILATGTSEIVRRAQASGTPTLGVGPGNVPVYVHPSADLELAARTIVHSKTFDNGTVCASEQALVVEPAVGPRAAPA